MKAIAINGSPRKKWSTGTLLESILAGAKAMGADTEMVHLYDIRYRGCVSCFACKRIGGRSYGRCAVRDGLTPILDRIAEADVLILGSPVYFYTETGEMRSFMERLLFPYHTYTPDRVSLFPRKIPTGFVYTMNVAEDALPGSSQIEAMMSSQRRLARIFGSCEVLLCTDTYQFPDYSKYLSTCFDADAKARRREEIFPQDCARARALGAKLVTAVGCCSDV